MTNSTKPRLLSLDFFRGITVAAMIMVNNPGSWKYVYAPLEHSKWNGCTPTDLIFPFFLFIVGVSVPYAMGSKKEDPTQHRTLILHALRRAAILILIGLLLRIMFKWDFATLRFPGVLQRIGLVFGVIAILYIKTGKRTIQWVFGSLLIIYCLLMTVVPVPGTGVPSLEPEANLGAWLDRLIFTPSHLWAQSKTWDPEGLLSTMPAVSTGLFGVMVGSWLRRKDKDDAVKVSWMFVYGFIAVILALIWDPFFPINKSLWTSSFVLYTGGLGTMALAMSYWLIDVQQRNKYLTPFVAFGRNAITAYVLSALVPKFMSMIPIGEGSLSSWLNESVWNNIFSPYNASLASALFLVFLIWIPIAIMYRKNIIVKI
ncbi:putative acyltransferase [Chitinophaga dinghuensis]|uniref:Putative acyltransferase n=1 Tax=Chitinophaga dinghuensis TaxID=1539050 RepID=A0A327VV50_9BACT|nr:heparan-alpha-glucosaminide N-acetyltransferase domain-containing protein [Chitinophaga dinghuensis]RAJ79143.1 putative acyltransferase [Chitinophaga dinghuensis]